MNLLNRKETQKAAFEWCQMGATVVYLKALVNGEMINVAMQNSETNETIVMQWDYAQLRKEQGSD